MTFAAGNKNAVGIGRPASFHGPRVGQIRQAIIAELNAAQGKGPTKLRQVVRSVIDRAIEGNIAAAQLLFERVDGKVPQAVTNTDGSALSITQNILAVGALSEDERALLREMAERRAALMIEAQANPNEPDDE